MTLAPATRLGPYQIVSPLGAGGMGEVYRAKDTRLGREVAIKVLPAEVANDPERLRRFEQEARAVSALNHPNILTLHDLGLEGGVSYLVTELLSGESLRDLVRRGALPVPRAVEIGVQIARGLAAAHESGIVHRDLKPENLFVTRDGLVKILDFGLAKRNLPFAGTPSEATTMAENTAEGTILGSVGYMAPEQVRGEPCDARSDLFALGCVLHELLTGGGPFARASAIESLGAILKEEPAVPPGAATVPPALDHVVRRCLEKRPERRFQTASDLAFALSEALAASTVSSPSVPAGAPPLARRRTRGPLLLSAALAAGLVVALVALDLGGLRTRLTGGAQPIDSLAVLPLANLSGDPQQEYFADGMTEALIAELAKLRALKVISRTSVMRFKGTERPLPEIARELGVRGVIEGSILRDADQLRITVQLIDARDDRHLWAESYTRPARDVLALQSEIARAIAREVRIAVTPAEEQALAATRVVDPEAHRLVLQAKDLIRRGSSQLDEQRRISELIDRAIAVAPDFAPAHILRAYQFHSLAGTGYQSGTEACPPARAALDRALSLDPQSIEARSLDAALLVTCAFDWPGALAIFGDLLDRAPGDASIHDGYSSLLAVLGRSDEALRQAARAWELDPLNDWFAGHRVTALTTARRAGEAVAFGQQALAVAPDSVFLKWTLGNAQLAQGDTAGALATFLSRKVANPGRNFMVGYLHARAGRRTEAQEVLDFLLERRRQRYVPAAMIAVIYGGLGERDAAFDWLERAFAERDTFIQALLVEPMFDPLRDDPRFDSLLARMGLAQPTP